MIQQAVEQLHEPVAFVDQQLTPTAFGEGELDRCPDPVVHAGSVTAATVGAATTTAARVRSRRELPRRWVAAASLVNIACLLPISRGELGRTGRSGDHPSRARSALARWASTDALDRYEGWTGTKGGQRAQRARPAPAIEARRKSVCHTSITSPVLSVTK